MTNRHYPTFRMILLTFGSTDYERARALGVSLRTFMNYKQGILPSFADTLLTHPCLLDALRTDAAPPALIQTADAESMQNTALIAQE